MLAIEVEFLTGVARLANDRGDGADWPPQPDRLFSALVATWAARGARAEEKAALEWLERAPAPEVAASGHYPRGMVKSYVPPNDDLPTSRHVLPEWRRRQERRFPAVIPHQPLVRWHWTEQPPAEIRDALAALARDTSYLGHSASLIRCFVTAAPMDDDEASPVRRSLYPGRLAELERRFAAGQRPSPGMAIPALSRPEPAAPASVFGADWIVFADAGGFCPDTLAAPLAAKAMLRAVQSGFSPDPAPEWISGHAADGRPSRMPHLAALPLLDAGWHWSQGRLMGLALAVPRAIENAAQRARDPDVAELDTEALTEEEAEARFHAALARLKAGEGEEFELELHLPGGRSWRLRRQPVPAAKSLEPRRYGATARRWATLTPLALDSHPKAPGETEEAIATACERIGLPRPSAVVAGKHSAVNGAPSARPGARAPGWARWRLPGSLAGRPLTHAVLDFGVAVTGPVILGAGRFTGLGLCLPLPAMSDP